MQKISFHKVKQQLIKKIILDIIHFSLKLEIQNYHLTGMRVQKVLIVQDQDKAHTQHEIKNYKIEHSG